MVGHLPSMPRLWFRFPALLKNEREGEGREGGGRERGRGKGKREGEQRMREKEKQGARGEEESMEELERCFSGEEHILLLHRTRPQFSAPMPGNAQPLVIPTPGRSNAPDTCTHMRILTAIHIIENKINL